MSHSDIQQLKTSDLSAEELRLQKAQQVIDELYVAANSDETLFEQLEAATSSESLVQIAARQGYQLAVADIETLLSRNQQQAQLNADKGDDDELSEQELELVAGGLQITKLVISIKPVLRTHGWPRR
ncbi:MAG: Nif11-like leader peptide family natural product precursor [Coleofasciculus sp. C3-bin4]|nr:Nif11-like leader peptide family natural product precursor [Coleofasciculus sp. C3-bin4]